MTHFPSNMKIPDRLLPEIGFYRLLANISDETYKKTLKFMKKNFLEGEKSEPLFLFSQIVRISVTRPKETHLLAKLAFEIYRLTKQKLSATTVGRTSIIFVKILYEYGIYTKEEIKGMVFCIQEITNLPFKELLPLIFKENFEPQDNNFSKTGYDSNSYQEILKYNLVNKLHEKNDLMDAVKLTYHLNPFDLGCKLRSASLLAIAAYYGSYECVAFLYQYFMKAYANDQKQLTDIQAEACMYSIMGGSKDVIKFFEDQGLQFNHYFKEAAFFNRNDKFELLMKNNNGAQALFPAAVDCLKYGNIEMALFLILQNPHAEIEKTDERNRTVLHMASRYTSRNFVDFLITKVGADLKPVCTRGLNVLHNAARYGRDDIVRLLVEQGANVKQRAGGRTVLHCASRSWNPDLEQFLIDQWKEAVNLKTKRYGSTPLFYAIQNNDIETCKVLCNNGADINVRDGNYFGKNMTPLIYACENSYYTIAKYLIDLDEKRCSELNIKSQILLAETYYKKNCLYYAARSGDMTICRYLVQKANNTLDDESKAKFFNGRELIAAAKKTDFMKFFLNCGSKFTQEYLNRAFRKAAKHGTVNELNFLYSLKSMKPDKDQIDKDGRTLLFYPMLHLHEFETWYSSEEMMKNEDIALRKIKFFVNLKLNVNACDCDSNTPLDLAIKHKYNSIIDYLKENGAICGKDVIKINKRIPIC